MNILKSFEIFIKGSDNIHFTKKEENGNVSTISFSYLNKNYVLFYEPNDPEYYRLMLPHIGKVDKNNPNYMSIIEELISLTTKYKVGKAILLDDKSVWLSYEQTILDIDGEYGSLFSRSINVLSKMLDDYRNFITTTNEPTNSKQNEHNQ
jgi:hypothetical protein